MTEFKVNPLNAKRTGAFMFGESLKYKTYFEKAVLEHKPQDQMVEELLLMLTDEIPANRKLAYSAMVSVHGAMAQAGFLGLDAESLQTLKDAALQAQNPEGPSA